METKKLFKACFILFNLKDTLNNSVQIWDTSEDTLVMKHEFGNYLKEMIVF